MGKKVIFEFNSSSMQGFRADWGRQNHEGNAAQCY